MMFLAKAKNYDETNNTFPTNYLMVCGDSFVEAMKQVEDYYGDCLENCELQALESSYKLTHITKAAYEDILNHASEDL